MQLYQLGFQKRLGMTTIGDIARTPLPELKRKFRAHFSKQPAEEMWRTANGLDNSSVASIPQKSIGHMLTLPKDYGAKGIWGLSLPSVACVARMKHRPDFHAR
ncbi:DNA polymerase IV [compost metagenome]